jgi:hypothetical protein
MIYMVEMDFPHAARLAEWHDWYLSHIHVLLTVPGFRASQRFEAVVPNPSPWLALHEVDGPDLFDSDAYRGRGGPGSTGEWRSLQTNWHRNLLDGLRETPDVPADAHLLLLRDAGDADLPEPVSICWLRGVGLDRTIAECGIAVIVDPAPFCDLARRDDRVRLFRPISPKTRAVSASHREGP